MENTPKDLGERFVAVSNKITQQNILDSYQNYLQAELIARLLIYNQPSKHVWVITGKLSSGFITLLNYLCDSRISPSVFNVHPDKLNNVLITDLRI